MTPDRGGWGTRRRRPSAWLPGVLAALALACFTPLAGGCLSNPTPHPGDPDTWGPAPDSRGGVQSDPDRDKANCDDGLTETPTGNYGGPDALVGDVDPSAAVDDEDATDAIGDGTATGGDGIAADGGVGGAASNEDDGDWESGDAGPTEPSADYTSTVRGRRPPGHAP